MNDKESWREQRAVLRAIAPEMEKQADGTVVLRKAGCTGVGPSVIEAIHDLHRKVDLAHGPALTEEERQAGAAEDESFERIYQGLGRWERQQRAERENEEHEAEG